MRTRPARCPHAAAGLGQRDGLWVQQPWGLCGAHWPSQCSRHLPRQQAIWRPSALAWALGWGLFHPRVPAHSLAHPHQCHLCRVLALDVQEEEENGRALAAAGGGAAAGGAASGGERVVGRQAQQVGGIHKLLELHCCGLVHCLQHARPVLAVLLCGDRRRCRRSWAGNWLVRQRPEPAVRPCGFCCSGGQAEVPTSVRRQAPPVPGSTALGPKPGKPPIHDSLAQQGALWHGRRPVPARGAATAGAPPPPAAAGGRGRGGCRKEHAAPAAAVQSGWRQLPLPVRRPLQPARREACALCVLQAPSHARHARVITFAGVHDPGGPRHHGPPHFDAEARGASAKVVALPTGHRLQRAFMCVFNRPLFTSDCDQRAAVSRAVQPARQRSSSAKPWPPAPLNLP